MKRWTLSMVMLLGLGASALAGPAWYECDVKWAGAGGGGVFFVLANPVFPSDLGPGFPSNSIMVSGGTDIALANRLLVVALSAMNGGKKAMVFTEPRSFSEVGGLYAVAPYESVPEGMVLILGGTNSGTDPDFGAYSLTVDSFFMDKYEVTKALWNEVKSWNGGNGYSYDVAGAGKAPNHPVYGISWYDCVKWCNARSEKEGRTPVYYTDAACTHVYKTGQVLEPYVKAAANGYRLPTEVEWEYAARGGVAIRRFPWGGDTIEHTHANFQSTGWYSYDTSLTHGYHPDWFNGSWPYTSPVGTFEPGKNGYGLYDMAGNVWEWCYDRYSDQGNRVARGASWYSYAYYCRIAYRLSKSPASTNDSDLGFRVCLSPGPQ